MSLEDFLSEQEVTPPKQQKQNPKQIIEEDAALRKDDIEELTEKEHCKLRSNTYIGGIREQIVNSYIYNDKGEISFQEVCLNSGLLKIVSEMIDNSVDEAIRCSFKYATKIQVTFDGKEISVMDDGRGLPIVLRESGKYTPEVIFTQLRAGSNFNDATRITAGMNGMGGSLCNIYSKSFSIDTANGAKKYQQEFRNSFDFIGKPKISESKSNYTKITFTPDYEYFNASDRCIKQLSDLIYKRLVNLSFCYPEITFYYNKKKINAKSLKQFLSTIHPVFEQQESEQCRIGIFCSETEFQHISFVNGLDTLKGGTHVNYISNAIVDYIRAYIKKKHKLEVKPIDIKSKLFLMISMRMTAPQFEGQIKEELTNVVADFKSIVDEVLTEKFLKSILKNDEIILPIVESYKLKEQAKQNLEQKKLSKAPKNARVNKYYPASKEKRYLILTEGDGANGLLMTVLGRDIFSYYCLQGKPLNALEAKWEKIRDHIQLKAIREILSMRMDKDDQSELTHHGIVFATDQDADGMHIKGLLLAYFYRFAKSLLLAGRIYYLRTPLVMAFKGEKVVNYFFDLQSYKQFESDNPSKGYHYKYFKGLGTHTDDVLKQLIQKEGLEKFIQRLTFDEEAEKSLISWLGKRDEDLLYRKSIVGCRSFDINLS